MLATSMIDTPIDFPALLTPPFSRPPWRRVSQRAEKDEDEADKLETYPTKDGRLRRKDALGSHLRSRYFHLSRSLVPLDPPL